MTAPPPGPVRFEKYEGLGNDFIVIEAKDEASIDPARAVLLCDRHRGIGADGVLLLLPPRTPRAVARMRVINADGSVPEMCGNGLRCLALRVSGSLEQDAFEIETDAGVRSCAISARDPGLVTVGMGAVRAQGPRTLDVDGERVEVWLADAGNPHAILFGPIEPARWARLAPRLSTHAAFLHGTNVGLAVVRDGGLDVVVWERGVGLTLACGTGACAAVAVAMERGLVDGAMVDVRLPGGTLTISRTRESGLTSMRGPARRVFAGWV